jgi:DNA-binding LacI/PurR family transcriptional regulator
MDGDGLRMTTPAAKRPTIRDVAVRAGVSRGTVSRVLNGGRWVSDEAEAAVRDAIVTTGYKPNPHARSLATNRSNSVAFLLTETSDTLFDDPVFSILVRGTAQALASHGQSLVVLIAGTPVEQARAADYITGGHVDGVLLAYSLHGDSPLVRQLLAAEVPMVAFGSPFGDTNPLGSVASDDYDGARQMVEHLQQRGRSRIAFIAGPEKTPGGVRRLAGYRDVLGDAFDADLVDRGDWTPRSGAEAMSRLLLRAPRLDAVFAANDQMAAGAMGVLHASGLSVPGDVAVGGFDDSNVASISIPSLTTIRQPFGRISTEGVDLLLKLMSGEPPATITLPVELIVRDST